MSKHINIKVDDGEYERLSNLKDEHGLTWVGMLQRGGKYLEEQY